MRRSLRHIIELITLTMLTACHSIEEFDNDNVGNFNALWTALDEHYCFFAEKDVDWDAVYNTYSRKVNNNLTRRQLFSVCADMVNELRDGHVNLASGFETSYYKEWWSEYPQNFNLRTIQEVYFNFQYQQLGNVIYGILPQNVGYVYIPSFSSGLSDSNINWILSDMLTCTGLIIDVRDNGGGSMNYAETWVQHFITQATTVGYISHKTGAGHDDFDDPQPIEFNNLDDSNIVWGKPVVILTNRSTYSAANYLVMCMRALPNVKHVGATTGGGSGIPLSLELPNGWGVRMSAVKVFDAQMQSTDSGIAPDEGCEVEITSSDNDSMIDFAINLLR